MIKTNLKEVENILINLGLEAGDQVLVHADLRVFGRLEGNGAGLIALLEELVGPQGLVCTPSFTFSFPQNFERKMNYYEMYTLKRASEHNDAEANEVIKRFQNEKFTGGMDNQENYQHAMHESNKFSNTV